MSIKDLTGMASLSRDLTGASTTMLDMFRDMKDLEAATAPAGIRMMRDLQRGLERQDVLFGRNNIGLAAAVALDQQDFLTKLDRGRSATSLHDALQRTMPSWQHHNKWLDLQRRVTGSAFPFERWSEIAKLAGRFGLGGAVHQLNRVSQFDRLLHRMLPKTAHDSWSAHLKAIACPSLTVLARGRGLPVGLVVELPEPALGASVAWLSRYRGDPVMMMAAITSESDPNEGVQVLTEGGPACGLCGTPMHSLGAATRWLGPRRGIRHRLVFPACSKCSERDREEPGYLVAQLTRLSRPTLRVIDGESCGDGVRRGSLRVLPLHEKDD